MELARLVSDGVVRSFTNGRQLLRLSSSTLMRNVSAVAGGTAASQLVVIAFAPLITRIYSPEVFGIQGVFLATISILSPLAALRYTMAIVVADTEAEVRGLVRLCVGIAAAVAIVTALTLLGFRTSLAALLGIEHLGLLIWFLPVALFLVALQDVMLFRASRLGEFRLVGWVTVLQAFLVNLARVLAGMVQPVAAMLVGVTTASFGLQALMLRIGAGSRLRQIAEREVAAAAPLLRKHREFPIYRMPADLANAVAQTAPVLLLSILFSPAAAGLYVLARSVVNLPLNVIGHAVGNVLYARIAEMARGGQRLLPFVAKATLLQLLVPGGATALAALIFPWLFAIAFGEAWREAGEFAQWMALWVICMLANVPSVRALPVIGRQGWHLLFNFVLLGGGIVGMLAGYRLYGTTIGSVAGYSLTAAGFYALQTAVYLYLVHRFDKKEQLGE